jgi:hypothetical protein
MWTQLQPGDATPSPEGIRVLITRAHRERNEAIRRFIGGLLFRTKPAEPETVRASSQKAAACV